jgi:hypothetical protein
MTVHSRERVRQRSFQEEGQPPYQRLGGASDPLYLGRPGEKQLRGSDPVVF